MFFVGVHVAREQKTWLVRMIRLYPLAGSKRRLAHHVLSGRVAGRIVVAQVKQRAYRILRNPRQLSHRGGSLRRTLYLREMRFDPFSKMACFQRIMKLED